MYIKHLWGYSTKLSDDSIILAMHKFYPGLSEHVMGLRSCLSWVMGQRVGDARGVQEGRTPPTLHFFTTMVMSPWGWCHMSPLKVRSQPRKWNICWMSKILRLMKQGEVKSHQRSRWTSWSNPIKWVEIHKGTYGHLDGSIWASELPLYI